MFKTRSMVANKSGLHQFCGSFICVGKAKGGWIHFFLSEPRKLVADVSSPIVGDIICTVRSTAMLSR